MPVLTYQNFDLMIEPTPNAYRAHVIYSPAGEIREEFKLPFTENELSEHPKITSRLARQGSPDPYPNVGIWRSLTKGRKDLIFRRSLSDFFWHTKRQLRHLQPLEAETKSNPFDPREFGIRLFKAVFTGKVYTALIRSMDEVERNNQGLRIRVHLNEQVPELIDLPWELLYAPDWSYFLATSSHTPLVRYINLPLLQRALTVDPPLRILAVIASPKNMITLNVEKEWNNLQTALANMKESIVLERLDRTTLADLQSRLYKEELHILHFIGHGEFDTKANISNLVFEDEMGHATRISADTLATLLRDHRTLRLIFLNACEGARGARTNEIGGTFTGIAQHLVQVGIPAVIAMQFPVSDPAAITLASEFYKGIANNFPIDTALTEARKAIYILGNGLEWSTPVLYMRTSDGHIFDVRTSSKRPEVVGSVWSLYLSDQPSVKGFLGRAKQINDYLVELESAGWVILGGVSGIGKTQLGIKLATEYQKEANKIFYFEFGSGTNDHLWGLICALVEFLANNGHKRAKAYLESSSKDVLRQEDIFKYTMDITARHVLDDLTQDDFVLCLDDLQVVDEDKSIQSFLEKVGNRTKETKRPKLVGMSQMRPGFIANLAIDCKTIEGFALEEVKLFLTTQHVSLSNDYAMILHEITTGSPGLLHYLLSKLQMAVKNDEDISALFNQFRQTERRHYIQRFFDTNLKLEERKFLMGLSVPRQLLDNEAIGYLLKDEEIQDVSRVREVLVKNYKIEESQFGRLSLREEVCEFYANELKQNHKMKQRFNRNLAIYYEQHATYLEAAYHYFEVNERDNYEKSAQLLCDNLNRLIYEGKAQPMSELLVKFRLPHLSPHMWLRTQEAMGDLAVLLGNYPLATQSYENALNISRGEMRLTPKQHAELRRKLGKVYERQGNAQRALEEYEKGSQELTENEARAVVRVRLMKDKAWSLIRTKGDFTGALELCQEGLGIVDVGSEPILVGELYNLRAEIALQSQALHDAEKFAEQSLKLFKSARDSYNLAASFDYLGRVQQSKGETDAALQSYEQAREASEQIGDKRGVAATLANIASLYFQGETYDQASSYTKKALDIFRQLGDEYGTGMSLQNLGELDFREGQHCQALSNWQQAIDIFVRIHDVEGLKEMLSLLDEISITSEPTFTCTDKPIQIIIEKLQVKVKDELTQILSSTTVGSNVNSQL